MQKTVYQLLEQKFKTAFTRCGIKSDIPIVLQESGRMEFGDYQVNGVMAVAKVLGTNPRELAAKVIATLDRDTDDMIAKLEVAGPGFINITLKDEWLAKSLKPDLLVMSMDIQGNVVIDMSSPNLAKEMHVGHLRSTVIGDALARINEYIYGKEHVKRQNHVGDWGTQFGMLIAYMLESNLLTDDTMGKASSSNFQVKDLEVFYQSAKQRFDEDLAFANKARACVVMLQNWDFSEELGKAACTFWELFRAESLRHCQEVYDLLGVNLSLDDVRGESYYEKSHTVTSCSHRGLAGVIERLQAKNLLVDSDGAKCIFFSNAELAGSEETPFIVQKKDGGYLYSTTDLATVDYRVHNLQASKILYVVDARQSFHFKQLFIAAKKAGFAHDNTQLIHVAFGTMMGSDGKPFKTRSGGTVKLIDLIDESIKRAGQLISARNQQWSATEVAVLARSMGISALKYADLSKNRTTDYIFNFDKMLAFDGNTAPYLLYAYTRINSIFTKADLAINDYLGKPVSIHNSDERSLGLHLVKFCDRLLVAAHENHPHFLCTYIYELAGVVMKFYESSPILKEENANLRASRLSLLALASLTLKTALNLLGIPVVERM